MIVLLEGILAVVEGFGTLVAWGGVTMVNLVVAAVGLLMAGVLALLPSMPAGPSQPAGGWVAWANWFYPIGPLMAGFAIFVGLWVVFLAIRIPLKWVRAL